MLHIAPWLTLPYQRLFASVEQDRLPHAWFMSYVPGSGEVLFITQFIATLFCRESATAPCGQCHSCLLYRAGTHPDFYAVEIEKSRRVIRIDQIRQVIDKVYKYAQQGGVKVIWIKRASHLNEAASNALLKTLEEPPEHTYFILSDPLPKHTIPTLRSRCHTFHIHPPSLEEGIVWLRQRCSESSENELATALLLSQNAPFAAENLLQPDVWGCRHAWHQRLSETVADGQFWPLLTSLQGTDASALIHWFCTLLVDALKAQKRAGRYITNRDAVPLVRMLARYDTAILQQWYTIWQTAAQHLKQIPGLNMPLILANMLAQSEMKIPVK